MVCFRPVPVRHVHTAPRSSALLRAVRLIACLFVARALPGTIGTADALETDPATVDESPALSFGNFEISHYLLDKNYRQFVAAHRAKAGQPPSADDIAAWFRLFIARLAIQARLTEEGYLARPEVRREVSRMERQILTQADGPLYTSLLPANEFTPARLRALHELSARVFDVVMVRFDDDATAKRRLGPFETPAGFEQAAQALARSGKHASTDLSDGPTAWPYGSFQEIADVIPEAPHGTVIGPIVRESGVYVLLVRSESKRPVPDFEASREQWERHVRRIYQNLIVRARRRQILRETEFQPDLSAVAQFAVHVRPRPGQPHTIDEKAALTDATKILATYVTPGGRRAITDRDFVHHFNQRIIRSLPCDATTLIPAVADIVVEEADHAAALAARFDQEPRFAQDRRNFELKQALDLYEHEMLAPQITITPAELHAYYTDRNERYAVTTEATGVIYQFDSPAAAAEALPRLTRGETAASAKRVIDPVVVRRDGPPLVRERPNALLLAMSDGRPFGPFEHGGRPAIFVKRSNGPREAPPLPEIENVVRQDLLREKLDALAVTLFEEQAVRRMLRIHFEFSKYGIDSPFGKTPAPAMTGSDRASLLTPPPDSPRSG